MQVAFTFSQTNQANTLETYNLSISINPDTAIITKVFEVGEVAAGTVAVVNNGDVSAGVFLTADWGPSPGVDDRLASLLANALAVSVFVSSDDEALADTAVFGGRFMDLVDISIHNFDATSVSDVKISVYGPVDRTGPTLLGKGIVSDFVFVAVSTSA